MNISKCVCVYSFSFHWHFCAVSHHTMLIFSRFRMHSVQICWCCCRSFTLLTECMTGEKSKYIPNKEIIFIHIQRTRGLMMKRTMRLRTYIYVYTFELRAIRKKKAAVEHCWLGNLFKYLSFTLPLCWLLAFTAIPFLFHAKKNETFQWEISVVIFLRHLITAQTHVHTHINI